MSHWDVNLYLEFGNERTRPAIDLVSRINVPNPKRVIDLGCGPGNSTEILRRRWPDAQIAGLDSSPDMIAAARKSNPQGEWILGDAGTWQADKPYDVVFSNAALHWVPNHEALMPRLLAQVAPGGVLAFQMPSRSYSVSHRLIMEIAAEPEWEKQTSAARASFVLDRPGFFYDLLAGRAADVDIWETEYQHVMDDHHAIVTWISGAALRPFLDAIPDAGQQQRFVKRLTERVEQTYPKQKNGKVLFPFRRLFVVAYAPR